MSVDQITAYAVELRIYKDQASVTTPGKYLEIPLPDEVANFDDVQIGETSFWVYLERDEDFSYLRYTTEERTSRHDLNLKHKGNSSPEYAVSLPAEFAVTNDLSPFQGVGHDDRVNIEIRDEDNEIRVYMPQSFPHRLMQLSEQGTLADFDKPLIVPVIPNKDDFTDLGKSVDADRYKVDIVPFYGQDEVFAKVMSKRDENPDKRLKRSKPHPNSRDSHFTGNPSLLDYVREHEEHSIPHLKADEIRVYHRFLNWDDGRAVSSDGQGLIYRETDTERARVILPATGQYLIEAEKDGYLTRVSSMPNPKSTFRTFLDGWTASQFYESENSEDPPQILLPIPEEGKGHWKTENSLEPRNFAPDV